MMHRLRQYDIMLRIMMLLISFAMMRCLPETFAKRHHCAMHNIINEVTAFAEGKHH